MRKNNKKWKAMACLIAAGFIFSSAVAVGAEEAGFAEAQSLYSYGDFTYELADNNAVVITAYTGTANEVIIPESIDGKEVQTVGKAAFSGNETLEQVEIPESVEVIEDQAFQNCTALKDVSIMSTRASAGLRNIGNQAFENCICLVSIDFPRTLQEIGQSAFDGCENLTEIYYNAEPEKWDQVTVGAHTGSFTGPTWFYTYYNSRYLDLIRYEGSQAEVKVPSEITGTTVWSVEPDTFSDCPDITEIFLPKTIDWVGVSAFSGSPSLENIWVEEGNTVFASVDGVLYTKKQNTLRIYPQGRKGSYELPDTLTKIYRGAFEGCTGLTEITIPESIEEIMDNAFIGCEGLQKVIYKGTQAQWEGLEIDTEGNDALFNAVLETAQPEELTVCFDAFGVENYDAVTVFEDSLIEEPSVVPEREGYEFIGWYNGEEEWNFKSDKVESNMTLTAKWMADEAAYTILGVAYDSNNRNTGYRLAALGSKFKLSVGTALATYPDNIISKNWWSSTPDVVYHSTNGDLETTAVANRVGTGIITCTLVSVYNGPVYDERSDTETFRIRVVNPAVSVSFSETSKVMTAGESDILDFSTAPGNNWARVVGGFQMISSDEEVVTVTPDGCLKAVSPGTATITATLSNGAEAVCNITVREEGASIKGDVDGSGKVDIADLRLVLRSVCGKVDLTDIQKTAADVESDGTVDIQDLRKILRFVCGKAAEL